MKEPKGNTTIYGVLATAWRPDKPIAAQNLSFDDIEECFPDEGAFGCEDGYTKVSAQWLHDFARKIEKRIAAQQETSRGSPVEFRASGVDGKPADAATTCNYKFPISDCPNMKQVQGDLSMTHEHYKCDVCGKRESLDYEEMR